jgi:hypothetical protein
MEESLNVALSSFVFNQIWLNFVLDNNNLCHKGKKKIKRKGKKKLLQRSCLSSSLVNFCTMPIKYFENK